MYDPALHPDISNLQDEDSQDFDIQLNQDEPLFLKGQTGKAGIPVEPVKIIRNQDGSLAKSAMNQSVLSKERRDIREHQQKVSAQTIPKDIMKA